MDIWSLGVLLYEMFHLKSPFFSDSLVKLEKNIRKCWYEIKKNINSKAWDLISLMLDEDSEKRPNINSILHHSFFNENKTDSDKKEGKGFIDHFKEAIKLNSFLKQPI